ncbi:metallophosphoesterase family protein [Bacillus dakarensis]|uniref:metallophosphoesterase family protein n=1 Tax=Robertmurraya dakarensis TaxID=1926278 RepID=UPI0009813F2D|nr:DNA repair exonuclease [Bacillus dakarensis]
MKKLKFIHAADLHLDSPMIGLRRLPRKIFNRLQESTFAALRNLVDAAIHHSVDFVIVAGDAFDHENRSLRAQVRLKKEFVRLEEAGIQVYLVHGNHDHLQGITMSIELPKNVHIFGDHVEVKKYKNSLGTTVHLYGFSYPVRHVTERKIENYQKLADADFHIGILHGNLEGNSEHGNYAPFQLNELIEKDFDYWALGHIHKRMILNEEPPVVYSGNIQGRNKKEMGPKGCYLVSMDQSQPELTFIETNDVVWKEVIIDGSALESIHDLFYGTKDVIESERIEGKAKLVQLRLNNLDFSRNDITLEAIQQFLETLQEEELEEASFVWPIDIEIDEKISYDKESLAAHSDFYSELFHTIDDWGNLEKSLEPLYKHSGARKFLSPLTKDELEDIKQQAEEFLLQKLLNR